MIKTIASVLLVLSSLALAANKPTTKPIGPNLAHNGGFENGTESWPFWPMNGCQAKGDVVEDVSHSGQKSFKISNKSPFAPNVYARAFQGVGGLEPFTTYRISCWAKGKRAGINWIGGGPGWTNRFHFPKGTFDWSYVEGLWQTGGNADDFELMICTESPTEAVWVDDVRFEAIAADVAKRDEALAKKDAMLAAQQKHFDEVRDNIAQVKGADQEPVIRLGLYIAQRYLDRVMAFPAVQGWSWSQAQLEEIDTVLNHTAKELELFKSQNRTPRPLEFPTGGKVTIKNGTFYTDTSAGKDRPWYFYGMGHFNQIMKDLPNFHKMGVTMVQDGRCGPSAMNEDGTLRENARTLLVDMKRADLYGIKTDYLLSPHYFPEWGWAPEGSQERADEVEGGGLGFLYFNIDHPRVKDAIGRWADVISKALKDQRALFSVCLSNEPVYDDSGKTKQTVGLYRDYLKEIHHGDLDALNKLYGTSYKSFDEVKPPSWGYSKEDEKNRAFYDWERFNKKHFADWHAWMGSIVRKNLPDVKLHAKPMIFMSMSRDQIGWGVDGEEFCAFSDIAGCDAYAFPGPEYKTYDWRGEEFWYDLLNSFRNQPVFNSENHLIPDGTGPAHIPMSMTRAQYWQGALHHQGVTTTWVWEEASDPSLGGSIYFRPANAYGAGRAFVDLAHFAQEVAAINQAPANVALLYSQPSIFWSEPYFGTCLDIYTHLNFLGQKITFVSEKMLQEGKIPDVKCIALPQATHVEDATIDALKKYVAGGGKVMQVGNGNLEFDQYHRKRENLPLELANSPKIVFGKASAEEKHQKLFDFLSQQGMPAVELRDVASGKLAWDVEYRVVKDGDQTLVPMINFAASTVSVKGPSAAGRKAIDVLSGEEISGDEPVKLEPMVPRLFKAQ